MFKFKYFFGFRRIHLVVTAIREFLQTVNSYSAFKHLDSSEKVQLAIDSLHKEVCDKKDIFK